MSTSQLRTGLLVAYVMEMGANPLLVTVAATKAPQDGVEILDRASLEAMRVVTDVPQPLAEWSLVPIANGLVAQVEQIQDDSKATQRARLLCIGTRPGKRFLEIIVPLGEAAAQVDYELRAEHASLTLQSDAFIEVSDYSAEIVGRGRQSLMILRLTLSDDALKRLTQGKRLSWKRPSSRVSARFFEGWFSLRYAASLSPFAFKNCI